MINKLEWDSDFFGINIAEINTSSGQINQQKINDYIKNNNIQLTQALCDIKNRALIHNLQQASFHFYDNKITFAQKIAQKKEQYKQIKTADTNDKEAVCHIAENLSEDSRFNIAPISIKKVKEFYALWAAKAIDGSFDDICLLWKEQEQIKAFCTIKYLDKPEARIGLISVDDRFQGQGFGSKLISSILSFLNEKGIKTVTVATEGKNINALNFYYKNGFHIKKNEIIFYR